MTSKRKRRDLAARRKLNGKLLAYSAGAGAAMLAGKSADANIVRALDVDQLFDTSIGGRIQLTMEGIDAEAQFYGSDLGGFSGFLVKTDVGDPNSFRMFNTAGRSTLVQQLSTRQYVGASTNVPNGTLGRFYNYVTFATPNTQGQWDTDGETAFFGFSFESEATGDTLYGWAEVERVSSTSGRLLNWAYEDSGDPIRVGNIPEPGTLGCLALGAAGLTAMRRRRS